MPRPASGSSAEEARSLAMSQNSTGQLRIVVPVVAAADYSFAPTDDTAVLRQIPPGGTVLHLPSGAQSGDRYEFADGDGSCSGAQPITVAAPSGTTIRGGSAIQFAAAFASGV